MPSTIRSPAPAHDRSHLAPFQPLLARDQQVQHCALTAWLLCAGTRWRWHQWHDASRQRVGWQRWTN